MDDCTESQEVWKCSSDMTRCFKLHSYIGDEHFFWKACMPKTFARLFAKMGIMKRENLTANYIAVKETSATEHCSKSAP